MRRDLPGDEALALAERGRAGEQARRDEREDIADEAEVGQRVHPHQEQVVALGEHVLVHLLRAAGWRRRGRPELSSLGGDADRQLGRALRQLAVGLGGADVVRLVDHDEHRLAALALAPQRVEHGGRERLLLARGQRAEIDHEAARVALDDVLGDRVRPPRDQIVHLSAPRFLIRIASCSSSSLPSAPGASRSTSAISEPYSSRSATGSSRSIAAWVAASSSARCSARPLAGAPHDDPRRELGVPGRLRRIGVVAGLPQPHEVRVRVEDDDAQAGRVEQPLQHGAERVGLPEPDWPQRNVCRSKPPASRPSGTPGASISSPISSRARAGATRSRCAVTSSGRAGRGERVVERAPVAVEHDSVAERGADLHAGPQLAAGLRPVCFGRLQRVELAEPCGLALLEHHVSAGLEGEPVQRGLEGEPPSVHRGRVRKDPLLEIAPQCAECRQLLLDGHRGAAYAK